MKPSHEEELEYGNLRLVPGAKYRVIFPFRDFDGEPHEPPQEWVYRGYDFLPYDSGLTIHVTWKEGNDGVIRLRDHPELQGPILDLFNRYVAPA